MRLLLSFHTDNLNTPIAYQYPLQGLIYTMLLENRDYADFLYNTGHTASGFLRIPSHGFACKTLTHLAFG